MSIYIPSLDKDILHWNSKKAISEARELFSSQIKDTCLNRKSVVWFTIDWAESRDLDDGIWVEKTSYWYRLQVSIADVSEIIPRNSILEKAAFDKATSIYLETHVNHMFPEIVSTDLASLNHQKERFALTVEVEIDKNFEIMDYKIFESNFYNENRFDYESYSETLLDKSSKFNDELLILRELSNWLYQKRKDSWVNFEFYDAQRKLYPGKAINKYSDVQKHLAAFCVEQVALTWNTLAAKFAIKNNVDVLFRNHMTDYKWKKFEWWEMPRAFYSEKFLYHYWLQEEEWYMHFTSPIRRLADFISHINLKKKLRGELAKYTKEDIKNISLYINERIYQVINFEKKYNKEVEVSRMMKNISKDLFEETDFTQISIHRMDDIIYYFFKNNKDFPEKLKNEIDRRYKFGLCTKNMMFLFLFSWKKEYVDKALSTFERKHNSMVRASDWVFNFLSTYLSKNIKYDFEKKLVKTEESNEEHIFKINFKSKSISFNFFVKDETKWKTERKFYDRFTQEIGKSWIDFFAE